MNERYEKFIYNTFKDKLLIYGDKSVPDPDKFIVERDGQPCFDCSAFFKAYFRTMDADLAGAYRDGIVHKIQVAREVGSLEDEKRFSFDLLDFMAMNSTSGTAEDSEPVSQEDIEFDKKLLALAIENNDQEGIDCMREKIAELST